MFMTSGKVIIIDITHKTECLKILKENWNFIKFRMTISSRVRNLMEKPFSCLEAEGNEKTKNKEIIYRHQICNKCFYQEYILKNFLIRKELNGSTKIKQNIF